MPNITWQWQPCSQPGCPVIEDTWEEVDVNEWTFNETRQISRLHTISDHNSTGVYQCIAQSKEGIARDQMKFIATGKVHRVNSFCAKHVPVHKGPTPHKLMQ
jgi:hypothetical protein